MERCIPPFHLNERLQINYKNVEGHVDDSALWQQNNTTNNTKQSKQNKTKQNNTTNKTKQSKTKHSNDQLHNNDNGNHDYIIVLIAVAMTTMMTTTTMTMMMTVMMSRMLSDCRQDDVNILRCSDDDNDENGSHNL